MKNLGMGAKKKMIRSVTKTEGSVTVFHLKDDLNVKKVKTFVRRVYDLIETGRHHLVLDMSEVNDSCLLGLVSISNLFNRCRQSGGSMKVCSLTPAVRRAFRETNLINTIEVYDTPLEALKSFKSQNLLQTRAYTGSFYLEDKQAFIGWDRLPAGSYIN